MKTPAMPHPVYFLVMKGEGQGCASLTALKDGGTGERFACVFVSAQDTEEFMVANDLTFDTWKISEVKGSLSIHGYCNEALRNEICECVINPPPVIRGVWRTLSIGQLRAWGQMANEPLLVWAGYGVPKEGAEK